MKKLSRIMAIVLCLAIALSIGALADWTQYQRDDNHNGVLPTTETAPYITNCSGNTPSYVPDSTHLGSIQLGSGGWSGIDSEPLMLTEGTKTYAYVTYNGGTVTGDAGGTRLAKIDVTATDDSGNVTPTKVWDIQLTLTSAFQLSTPTYYNGNIYVAGSGLSQLLLNNNLVLTEGSTNYYEHWNVTPAGSNIDWYDGAVEIVGNSSATFISDAVDITSGYTHRPAMGIYLGSTAPTGTAKTVQIAVSAIDVNDNNNEIALNTYTFSPSESSSSYKPIAADGGYYYYLNHNLTSAQNALLTGTSYKFKYVVTVTNNASDSVDVEYCSFFEQTSTVFEVSDLTNTAPTCNAIAKIGKNGGQINTPIVGCDYTVGSTPHKCIYFGTYGGTHSYYQYDITANTLKTFTPASTTGGFYWAGAYCDATKVVFGGDNGYLYYTTPANFGTTKQEYSLDTLGGISDAGNVRSSILYYGGYFYFTSQGGTGTSYLWKVNAANIANLSSTGVSKNQLSGSSSTSTPVISNGRIYAGYYSGFSAGGVDVIDASTFSDITSISVGPVQSSVVVYASGTTDYIFFTTNAAGGAGYCYSYDGSNATALWQTPGATYALQGMGGANGYLAFGNDGHVFYVIKP